MVRFRGEHGALRIGYQQAAELVAWEVEAAGKGRYALSADLADVSAYWMMQGPIDASVQFNGQVLRWWDVSPVVTDEGRRVRIDLRGAPCMETA